MSLTDWDLRRDVHVHDEVHLTLFVAGQAPILAAILDLKIKKKIKSFSNGSFRASLSLFLHVYICCPN